MRNNLFLLLVICLCNTAIAQTQLYGFVLEQSSGKKPVPGVTVNSLFANQKASNTDGSFLLTFQNGKSGMNVTISAEKEKWLIINDKEMNLNLPENPQTKPLNIIMCRVEVYEANRKKYYGINDNYIKQEYEKKLKAINKEKKGWEKEVAELQDQMLALQKQLKDIADIYARTNDDDLSEKERTAYHLFEAGEIDSCIALRKSFESEKKLLENKEDYKKIDSLKQQLDSARLSRENEDAINIRNIQEEARLAKLKNDFKTAEEKLAFLVTYDSSNMTYLFNYAHFLHYQNNYEKNIARYYLKALSKVSTAVDSASILNNLGALYWEEKKYAEAGLAYTVALEIRKRLAAANPAVYEPDLAATQNNLGNLYSDEKKYAEAGLAYTAALEIKKRLAAANPAVYEPDLAGTQNNQGLLYREEKKYAEAGLAYRAALEIRKRLAAANPAVYEPDLATTLNNLGILYSDEKKYAEAGLAYTAALEIKKRLAAANPAVYEPDLAGTQNNQGLLYREEKKYAEAGLAFAAALEIRKRLAAANPAVYEPDLAGTQNNLGILYSDEKKYAEAGLAYTAALEIYKRLAAANPAVYEPDYERTLSNISSLYLEEENIVQFLKIRIASMILYRQLVNAEPGSYVLKYGKELRIVSTVFINFYGSIAPDSIKQELQHGIKLLKTYSSVTKAAALLAELQDFDFRFSNLHLFQQIDSLKSMVAAETDYPKKIQYTEQLIELRKKLVEKGPLSEQTKLGIESGNLSWYLLFTKQFAKAEEAARKGLFPGIKEKPADYDSSVEWIYTNLALSLLLQGKYEAAEEIYRSMKDKPYNNTTYGKTFLQDFDDLEKAGITHPDMERIRELLNK